ncbi:MAG TPA: hypothetical protein VFO07_13315, partial [Roseiflexaceae bacterium]|nr:hypothetical protein [Roseiflexaceae bacterium]
MDEEQRQHLKRLRQMHIDRLRYLEEQEARRGIDTPAEVLVEIKKTQAKITEIEIQLGPYNNQAEACQYRAKRLAAAITILDGAISAIEVMLMDIPQDVEAQALLAFI